MNVLLVAIDGPAGSGKTTVAKEVAARLGLRHLDTGAMYRSLAYKLINEYGSALDEGAVGELLASTQISFANDEVILDGKALSTELRTPAVSAMASKVAAIPSVREWMVEKQRELMHTAPGFVAEGRDIATVVAPDAQVKVFLTADPLVRASRRAKESGQTNDAAMQDLQDRDLRDEQREHSPLTKADDAIVIDTTKMQPSDVVAAILELVKDRMP